jgi:hypothetical protein
MAVAGAISFGLGNRELAGRITRDWYEQRRTSYRQFTPTSTMTREQLRAEEELRKH